MVLEGKEDKAHARAGKKNFIIWKQLPFFLSGYHHHPWLLQIQSIMN